MNQSPISLAQGVISAGPGTMQELRIHEFVNDEAAHDDEAIKDLYLEFSVNFDQMQTELSEEFGNPCETGSEDTGDIPLSGVFRYAKWEVGGQRLYMAAAHEDRELPILLMIGIA
jgi:hypothetical protein